MEGHGSSYYNEVWDNVDRLDFQVCCTLTNSTNVITLELVPTDSLPCLLVSFYLGRSEDERMMWSLFNIMYTYTHWFSFLKHAATKGVIPDAV